MCIEFAFKFIVYYHLGSYNSQPFWEGPYQKYREQGTGNFATNFWSLMQTGFERRLYSEQDRFDSRLNEVKSDIDGTALLDNEARTLSMQLSTPESQDEMVQQLKLKKERKSQGLFALAPSVIKPYINYLFANYKKPKTSELQGNLLYGLFFALLIIFDSSGRTMIFTAAGYCALATRILFRNMQSAKPNPDIPAGRSVLDSIQFSTQSLIAATLITTFFGVSGSMFARLIISLIPGLNRSQLKGMLISAAGMIPAAVGVSYFEVFEDAANTGSRWKKAQDMSAKVDFDSELAMDLSVKDAEKTEPYDFEYDPDIDDYPGAAQRYQHDIDIMYNPEKAVEINRELFNPDDAKHFAEWEIALKDMQVPPLMPDDVDDDFVGAEDTFLTAKGPKWVRKIYMEESRRGSKWKNIEQVFKSNMEKDPITGPPGFRDATPKWIKDIADKSVRSDGKNSPERKHEFGTYRRSMWKIDKDVKPLKADGVQDDPNPNKGPEITDDEEEG